MTDTAAVVLAAGAGTRLRPLTGYLPKALCPVGSVSLLDRALTRLDQLGFSGPEHVAVNVHHMADRIADAAAGRAHVSPERPAALGTAGTLAGLHRWIDDRDVLVINADAYLDGDVSALLAEDPGDAGRVLVTRRPGAGDFGDWRYVGMATLRGSMVAQLTPEPAGLYEQLWSRIGPGLVPFTGTAIDCGTPRDYLAANLHASGGVSVIGPGAIVAGWK